MAKNDIRIRRYQPDDVERLYDAARESIPCMAWMPWCHPEYSIDEARQNRFIKKVTAWVKSADRIDGSGIRISSPKVVVTTAVR